VQQGKNEWFRRVWTERVVDCIKYKIVEYIHMGFTEYGLKEFVKYVSWISLLSPGSMNCVPGLLQWYLSWVPTVTEFNKVKTYSNITYITYSNLVESPLVYKIICSRKHFSFSVVFLDCWEALPRIWICVSLCIPSRVSNRIHILGWVELKEALSLTW